MFSLVMDSSVRLKCDHFRGKQSGTKNKKQKQKKNKKKKQTTTITVVYIGTLHFAGELFVYFCLELTWSMKTLF